MAHVANLFKLNNLFQNVDFETLSLPKLKEHYARIKSLKNNNKLLNSLPDKGEKYLKRLQNIEGIILKRCSELEEFEAVNNKENISTNDNDLGELLNKFQGILIEKNKTVEVEIAKNEDNNIKDENLLENTPCEVKTEVKNEKVEPIIIKSEKIQNDNYFARKAPKQEKIDDELKLRQIKEKILKNMVNKSKFPKAKMISLQESFLIVKEQERRVQEFQIQQAANKLLEGKSTQFEYNFSINKNELGYREQKDEICSSSTETDSDDEDEFYNYYDDEDGPVDKIDRLHRNENVKQKFKLNNDDF